MADLAIFLAGMTVVLVLIGYCARHAGQSYSAHTTGHTHHQHGEDTSWLPW